MIPRTGHFAALAGLLAWLLCLHGAAAADSDAYLVDRWTIANGLPVNGITALQFDQQGYLWLATFGGLARFDGQRFEVFERSRSIGLTSNRLVEMAIDGRGVMWLRGENSEFLRFADGSFQTMGIEQGLPDGQVHELLRLADGGLAVATGRGAARLQGDRFEALLPQFPTAVSTLFQASDGCVWIGHYDGGLSRACGMALAQRYTLPAREGDTRIYGLAQGHDGDVLVAAAAGLFRVHEGELQPVAGAGDRAALAVAPRPGGDIVFYTGTGALAVADGAAVPADLRFPTKAWGMNHRAADGSDWVNGFDQVTRNGERVFKAACGVNGFAFGGDDAIWLATSCEGLVRLRPRRIAALTAPGAIDAVYGMVQAGDGAIWLSARVGGVEEWRDGQLQRRLRLGGERTGEGIDREYIRTLFVDRDGSLWVGQHGVCRVEGEHCVVDPRMPAGIEHEDVRALFRDRDGSLWIGGVGHLWREHGGQWTAIPNPGPSPRLSAIRSMLQLRDGTLWMGSAGAGLARRRGGAFEYFDTRYGLSSDSIRDLYEDEAGQLWVVTEDSGLCRCTDPAAAQPRFACVGRAQGLHSDSLHRLIADDDGRFWFNSNQGVFWLTRDALQTALDHPGTPLHPRVYGEREGLPSAEGNGGVQNAGLRLADGRIAFPNQAGVAILDPRHLASEQLPPRVAFEEITLADGRSLGLPDAAAELPLGERALALRYTGLSAGLTNPLYFRYRLLPEQPLWQELGAERQLRLNHLAPGDYRIEIAAFDAAEGVDGAPSAVDVRIPARWYERRLVHLASAAAAALLLALWLLSRQRAVRLRQRRLERAVARRTADLREQQQKTEQALRDVSRQREEIVRLAAAKSNFFANVSHELRTPLAVILGPLRDAARGRALPPARLQAMLRHGGRLERLIEHMLDLERLDAKRFPLHPIDLDLGAVLRDSAAAFEALAAQSAVTLQLQLPDAVLGVRADEDQLARVFGNLLSNALKFAPRTSRVRVQGEEHDGEVVVAIEDEGPGVPQDWRERIFDRFAQVGSEATRPHEGAGLGLALCREIVALHGGRLWVEPAADGGARFVLALPTLGRPGLAPLPRAADSVVEAPAVAVAQALPPGERLRVLIAEDNPDLRSYLVEILAAHFDVDQAEDGEEALQRARDNAPDLIVSDIMMPRLDGYGLARALRADAALDGVPLVFLTARASDEDEIRGLDTGADQYLRKPFDAEVLLAHLRAAVHAVRRLRRRAAAAPSPLPAPLPQTLLRDPFLAQALAWLGACLHDDKADVDALAGALHVSRATLYRRFITALGESPAAVLQRLRLERARALLQAGEGSVSEVAYAVGFTSLGAFTQAWRKRYGEAPARL